MALREEEAAYSAGQATGCALRENPAESVWSGEWAIGRMVVEQFNAAGLWMLNSEGPAETDQMAVRAAGVDAQMWST